MKNCGDLVDNESAIAGGVPDMYGEDSATLDQPITPWTLSVARWLIYSYFCTNTNIIMPLASNGICLDFGVLKSDILVLNVNLSTEK